MILEISMEGQALLVKLLRDEIHRLENVLSWRELERANGVISNLQERIQYLEAFVRRIEDLKED